MRKVVLNITFFSLAFSILFTSCLAAQSALVSGNQEIFGDYYSFLKRIAVLPADSQIEHLKSYIQAQPGFERPYHQLLTLYFEQNQVNEAERYFRDCADHPEQTRNCTWALSTLAAVRDSNEVAFSLLKSILQERQPTPYLLMEFTDYFSILDLNASFKEVLNEMQLSPHNRYIALAFYYSNIGDYAECDRYLNRIPQSDEFKLYVLHMNAFVQQAHGKQTQAQLLLQKGLAEAKRLGDEQFYIQFLISLTGVLLETYPDLAIQHCQDALNRAEAIHDVDRMISAHEMSARIFIKSLDLDIALEHTQNAIEIASKQLHQRSLARLYLLLGHIQTHLTNYAKALEHFEQSIIYSSKTNDINSKISALRAKGDLYMELNLFDLANHEFTQAIQLADSSAYPIGYNITLVDWAAQLYETHNFDASRKLLTLAIDSGHLSIPHLVYAYFHLATCYEVEKDFKMALTTYEKVCELVDTHFQQESLHYFKALALPQRANIETQFGNYHKADSLLAEPIIQKEMQRRIAMKIDFYSSLGYLRFRQKDVDGAVDSYATAASFVENHHEKIGVEHFRIGYYGQTSEVYQKLVVSLYKRYRERQNPSDLDQIFTVLQKCSGRSLQDLAPQKKQTAYPQEYINAVDSLQHLQRRLRDSVWKNESPITNELHAQHNVARHALLNQRGLMLDQMSRSKPKEMSANELQDICGVNNLNVLLYHVSDSISFALVIQADTLALIPLDIQRDLLNTQIYNLMAPLHDVTAEGLDSVQFHANVAHDLYATIFQPITEQISLSENLVVVPSMDLLNLPFEMLLTDSPQSKTYTPRDSADYAPLFLQHKYTFTYSPILAPLLKSKKKKAKSIIVFSNPIFYSSEVLASLGELRSVLRSIFMQLPNADKEAQRIAETTHAVQVKGENVTKGAVLKAMKKYNIVHIATHAFADSVFDAYSGLALATADATDDGLLMGYELLDVSLKNDLIVLSACESGAGQFVAGEGVLGLPRLFLRAGARSVLMSLWKVHDPFPTHLMPTFYEFYLQHPYTKAEALALAKRQILTNIHSSEFNYKHPFFWATFCMYGSPGLARPKNHRVLFLGIGFALFIAVAAFTCYKRRR